MDTLFQQLRVLIPELLSDDVEVKRNRYELHTLDGLACVG